MNRRFGRESPIRTAPTRIAGNIAVLVVQQAHRLMAKTGAIASWNSDATERVAARHVDRPKAHRYRRLFGVAPPCRE